jgi:hypothetical protein
MIKNALFATAAAALAIAPVAAQAQSANAPTVERSAKPVSKKAGQMEGGSGVLLGLLAAAAVIAGIVIAVDGGDDDPVSP